MKKEMLALAFASVVLVFGACKSTVDKVNEEVDKVTDCTKAADEYKDANAKFASKPTEENCHAQNTAVGNYREKCENMPDGIDSANCKIYDITDVLD